MIQLLLALRFLLSVHINSTKNSAMTGNTSIETTTKFPNEGLDFAIGTVLSLASLFGAIMNITAFSYFKKMRARNNNNKFFKRLYMVISFTDILICSSFIPVIETAFTANREGFLFRNETFCSAWGVFWYTAYQISILMVTTLSISRFIVIKRQKHELSPWVPYVLLGVVAISYVVVFVVKIHNSLLFPVYYRELLHCSFQSFPAALINSSDTVSVSQHVIHSVFSLIIYGVNIVSSLVVGFSFVSSLVYLSRSRRAAKILGSSQKYQREASKTVMIVTVLYLLASNLFLMIIFPYSISSLIANPIIPEQSTIRDQYETITKMFGSNVFLNNYAIAIFYMVSTCLNSAMNPVVYFLRIRLFRAFVVSLTKKLQEHCIHVLRMGSITQNANMGSQKQAVLHPENNLVQRHTTASSPDEIEDMADHNNEEGHKYLGTGSPVIKRDQVKVNEALRSNFSIRRIHRETGLELSAFFAVN